MSLNSVFRPLSLTFVGFDLIYFLTWCFVYKLYYFDHCYFIFLLILYVYFSLVTIHYVCLDPCCIINFVALYEFISFNAFTFRLYNIKQDR